MTAGTVMGLKTKTFVSVLTVAAFVGASVAIITVVAVQPDSDAPVAPEISAIWGWDCVNEKCEKIQITDDNKNTILGLDACKMICNDYGNMWPRPTGDFMTSNEFVHINTSNINIILPDTDQTVSKLLNSAKNRFLENVKTIFPPGSEVRQGEKLLTVNVNIQQQDKVLTLETDESYTVKLITSTEGNLKADIEAKNFFGARHGLETLVQFIIFDDIRKQPQMIKTLDITDKPVYPYRGVSLDTSRNFYDVATIKRSLDGMAATKLNTFHWHITDSHSFSFQSKSFPELTEYGSITPYKIYTVTDIEDIVQYALERGIRVIPEFDAPAHVGEGWQWTDFVVCFKKQPWDQYCYEPPCGQFNPTIDDLYVKLEGVYKDLFEAFKPVIFHMGGDEVKTKCWEESDEIKKWMVNEGWGTAEEDYFKLWDYFQKKVEDKVYKANGGGELPLILWSSTLAESKRIETYLPKEKYIIQMWTDKSDAEITNLLDKGYRLIISNYDALYLDCGFGSWVGDGHNWCSPYVSWQTVYNNSLSEIAGLRVNLVLGGEAALWSEQADTSTLDSRLWPRCGALGERLWAEPKTKWRSAERRILHFRERLVKMKVMADSIQPEWCYQNEGECNLD